MTDSWNTRSDRVRHEFPPVYREDSRILILGSFPSVKSREQNFYYAHPRNRFWQVMAALTDSPVPTAEAEKRELLYTHHIALWDVIASCRIQGSSDSTIRDVKANDIGGLLERTRVRAVYANGDKAFRLYEKYCREQTGMDAVKLPSTSPANAAWPLERLIEEWSRILG